MKEYLTYLLSQIISQPEKLKITETQDEYGWTYSIRVAPEDMGFVIGKEGKSINALRELAKAKAIKDNIRIRIVLEDDQREASEN